MPDKKNSKVVRYIDPVTDFGFKQIFEDEEITMGFLNDLVHTKDKGTDIVSLTFLNKNATEPVKSKRNVIFDIRCKTNSGEEFIIEMQNSPQDYFSDRVVLYMARTVSMQQRKGLREFRKANGEAGKEAWNYKMSPVYGVFFMNFFDKARPKKISHCALMDTDSHEYDSKLFQYWKIQLPFYREITEEDCETDLDKWFYILANMSTMEKSLPFINEKPLFKKLEEISEYSNLTEEQQLEYDLSLDDYIAYCSGMRYEYNNGVKEGEAKERAKAHAKDLESAYTLFMSGALTLEQIASAMKLDLDELSNYIIDKQKKGKE